MQAELEEAEVKNSHLQQQLRKSEEDLAKMRYAWALIPDAMS